MNLHTEMNLPTEQQCQELFEQYCVPHNIKEHCEKVRLVAVFLAKKLQQRGEKINIDLVDKSALLHDLFKVVVLEKLGSNKYHHYEPTPTEVAMWRHLRKKYPGKFESEVAYDLFKDDYPELAITLKNASHPVRENRTPEELVVHYADWITLGTKVVSLDERLAYLFETYPQALDLWKKSVNLIKEQEKQLFSKIDFPPADLPRLVEEEAAEEAATHGQ